MSDELTYAKDVLWVYEHLGTEIVDLKQLDGVTNSRLILYEWIGTPEGRKEFLKTLLPKAQEQLVKAKANKDPDSIIETETKKISELKQFVQEIVEAALEK